MPSPIALQLYSVREAIAASNYETMVRKVAEIGYAGVETAGFPGTTPQAAGKLFKELGLKVPSIHGPFPTADKKQEILDILGAVDSQYTIAGGGPDRFRTVDDIRETCDIFNNAAVMLAPYGVKVGYHNHWWEYLPLDNGKYAYEYMLDFLSPEVFFEIDTYWVKTAGVDPAAVVKRLGKRAPYLHIKDGPAQKNVPQLAVGEGVIDVPAIIEAGKGCIEWLIVELDGCATDMLEAVRKSHAYLASKGLASGK